MRRSRNPPPTTATITTTMRINPVYPGRPNSPSAAPGVGVPELARVKAMLLLAAVPLTETFPEEGLASYPDTVPRVKA